MERLQERERMERERMERERLRRERIESDGRRYGDSDSDDENASLFTHHSRDDNALRLASLSRQRHSRYLPGHEDVGVVPMCCSLCLRPLAPGDRCAKLSTGRLVHSTCHALGLVLGLAVSNPTTSSSSSSNTPVCDPTFSVCNPRAGCGKPLLVVSEHGTDGDDGGYYSSGFTCELCAAPQGRGTRRWNCRTCRFDICLGCAPLSLYEPAKEHKCSSCSREFLVGGGEGGERCLRPRSMAMMTRVAASSNVEGMCDACRRVSDVERVAVERWTAPAWPAHKEGKSSSPPPPPPPPLGLRREISTSSRVALSVFKSRSAAAPSATGEAMAEELLSRGGSFLDEAAKKSLREAVAANELGLAGMLLLGGTLRRHAVDPASYEAATGRRRGGNHLPPPPPPAEDSTTTACPVCFDAIDGTAPGGVIGCLSGHPIHAACASALCLGGGVCPQCREPLFYAQMTPQDAVAAVAKETASRSRKEGGVHDDGAEMKQGGAGSGLCYCGRFGVKGVERTGPTFGCDPTPAELAGLRCGPTDGKPCFSCRQKVQELQTAASPMAQLVVTQMNRLRIELSTVQAARAEVQGALKALQAERATAASAPPLQSVPQLLRQLTARSQALASNELLAQVQPADVQRCRRLLALAALWGDEPSAKAARTALHESVSKGEIDSVARMIRGRPVGESSMGRGLDGTALLRLRRRFVDDANESAGGYHQGRRLAERFEKGRSVRTFRERFCLLRPRPLVAFPLFPTRSDQRERLPILFRTAVGS
jgi:hypothetical protein